MVNHGADSAMIIENMSNRLQKLEQAMVEDGDLFNSFVQESKPLGSPSRYGNTLNNNNNKKSMNRIRRIEEHLFELDSQIKENETDIEQLKQSLMKKFRATSRSESPSRHRGNFFAEEPETTVSTTEIKEMERKIKKLAESTTKACKSLSSGLTDVQQATLSLYSWTDRVHDSFEVVGQKLNLPPNFCPRAKLSSSSSGHHHTHHHRESSSNNNNNYNAFRRLGSFDF
jgi:chromosome segregation ATPase